MSLSPPSRMSELADRLEEVRSRGAASPCGSFTFAYHCMCDYHSVPFSEEVAWVSTVHCTRGGIITRRTPLIFPVQIDKT